MAADRPTVPPSQDGPQPEGNAFLVVAAGRGSRVGGDGAPKQYRPLAGRTVLRRTLEAIDRCPGIDRVMVVIHPDDEALYHDAIAGLSPSYALLPPAHGGETRQRSVLLGLRALSATAPRHVLVHDAARPFLTPAIVAAALETLGQGQRAVLAALPVSDTLKKADETGANVATTVDRAGLYGAQTPQSFDFASILSAHEAAAASGVADLTDDASVAQWAGLTVALVPGDPANIKITTGEDLMQADERLRMLEALASLGDIRTATAYDVHAFEPGDHVMLGGIRIDHDHALKGHSDADVVLHALTDAVLATICDGDIGHHFPPGEAEWHKATSDRFLRFAVERVAERGGRIRHLDATIVCEHPKIGPHRETMRASIARIAGLPLDRVSVKATTSEKLGFTGRGEGIAALATATVALPLSLEDTDPEAS
ncbi:MAG: bifunctional 2-C-methyl-D-erythritol 4-phosphate cytidylyltransferase/2-C-methyl-D-erythritol 2,4-cyclodiphosphate synthase [Stappia sp.]|uniref:bifunctional 2-C-methyl-D-erythritol 4-phosphate cytidylyltransferase/2-C-methyl-D-erythritol 2,4-cyclodiphosphate synthase n=1 Tax=Stappia sp. TaxID=1870903 RepID=UPI000C577480|nr:bifunctional 2-C-methyl-D-erythritol 4-phosphate cytidylyltransferase/2-C-methyl-D-erythritol 2,4-cyclodiphosphate synthase [Stappia sp.]MAA97580.1 bifunctional 2-C-methyl-D-erythritol 4-phosphate cytidylyltransferase/2-C-methyl-D-erythritol 2,4-cyclodiphosphate synthase [Stappia sp.]MBM22570.1 bifunctional 2-C-methyl-D-erythritol 4-phosphate cytidylyltransferase/2-C-methyl-D-erythritol 2,4-cyclodiphosphate synthase [Stappia sp.]